MSIEIGSWSVFYPVQNLHFWHHQRVVIYYKRPITVFLAGNWSFSNYLQCKSQHWTAKRLNLKKNLIDISIFWICDSVSGTSFFRVVYWATDLSFGQQNGVTSNDTIDITFFRVWDPVKVTFLNSNFLNKRFFWQLLFSCKSVSRLREMGCFLDFCWVFALLLRFCFLLETSAK